MRPHHRASTYRERSTAHYVPSSGFLEPLDGLLLSMTCQLVSSGCHIQGLSRSGVSPLAQYPETHRFRVTPLSFAFDPLTLSRTSPFERLPRKSNPELRGVDPCEDALKKFGGLDHSSLAPLFDFQLSCGFRSPAVGSFCSRPSVLDVAAPGDSPL